MGDWLSEKQHGQYGTHINTQRPKTPMEWDHDKTSQKKDEEAQMIN